MTVLDTPRQQLRRLTRFLLEEFPEEALEGEQVADVVIRLLKKRELKPRPLSPRQQEVLRLYAEGKSFMEIGRILGIGVSTVKWHKGKVAKKLGLKNSRNSTEFVRHAIRNEMGGGEDGELGTVGD